MGILGLRGTGDWGADERPKSFRDSILWLDPNGETPLTGLMSRAKSESVDDPEFSWWTEKLQVARTVLTGAAVTAATQMSVTATGGTADATDFVPGDILMVEPAAATTEYIASTAEIIVVSAASTTAGTLNVTKGAYGSTPIQHTSAGTLIKVGNAYQEGTRSPGATTRNPVKDFNYCQIFKTAYELTETAKRTKSRTGDPLKNDKKRRMFDHSAALEMAFLFGRKFETTVGLVGTSNGKPVRGTQGLKHFLAGAGRSFVQSAATVSEKTFLETIASIWDVRANGAGDERLVLCGNTFLLQFNLMAKGSGQIQFTDTVKYYGMNLQRYVCPLGTLYFKRHPLLNQTPVLQKSAFILDMSSVRYRYMRDTTPQDNIQENDADTQKGQWLTEAGLEVLTALTSFYYQNFVFTNA